MEDYPAHAPLAAARRPRSTFLAEQIASQLAWIREATCLYGDADRCEAGHAARSENPHADDPSAPADYADARPHKKRRLATDAPDDSGDDYCPNDMLRSLAPAGPSDVPSQVELVSLPTLNLIIMQTRRHTTSILSCRMALLSAELPTRSCTSAIASAGASGAGHPLTA